MWVMLAVRMLSNQSNLANTCYHSAKNLIVFPSTIKIETFELHNFTCCFIWESGLGYELCDIEVRCLLYLCFSNCRGH